MLHNFLLNGNDEGNEVIYEDDVCTSDLDADNELNEPISESQRNDVRSLKLTQCFAQYFCN